jgi:hypothetical protein
VILVEVIGIWMEGCVGTWELGKLIHLLLHVVDGLFGRWSTAINCGAFRAVSGDGEGKQQEDKGRFWMYAWMRSTVADLSACLQMIPKLEPHPPAHWPLCKLTPIWNCPNIPLLPFQKLALQPRLWWRQPIPDRSGPIANLEEGAGIWIKLKPEPIVS